MTQLKLRVDMIKNTDKLLSGTIVDIMYFFFFIRIIPLFILVYILGYYQGMVMKRSNQLLYMIEC